MMVFDMQDPELIWTFGQWLAQRRTGEVRLASSAGTLALRLVRGKIVAAEPADPGRLARRLGCRPAGHPDLVAEALALAASAGLAERQAVAAVKELIQESLASWLLDPGRQLQIVDRDVSVPDGPTISAAHAVVELVLSSQDAGMTRTILPDLDIRLRRAADFLELYSPLRLSEEADLIVAKVNGQRTAAEIAGRSPQGHDDVLNLLAALVAAGMLEPAPAAPPAEESAAVELPPEREARRRRLPVWLLLVALAVLIVIVLVLARLWQRSDSAAQAAIGGAEWGLVVDMGCEPQELQRILKKTRQYPEVLRAVPTQGAEGGPCWRLIWGHFSSREGASRAIADIPAHLKLEGFAPHPVEMTAGAGAGASNGGG